MYYIYIITNAYNKTLYIGVTGNIEKRTAEHKLHIVKGFSDRYNLEKLIYVEGYNNVNEAIAREKQLKGWSRAKKEALIAKANPEWKDLEL